MIELRRVGPAEFSASVGTAVGVYVAAMRPPPDQVPGRAAIMHNHTAHPGFTCVLAEAPVGGTERRVVGFGYGFHGAPGQWWHDVVRGALAERAGWETARRWLDDVFEVAEVHVHPDHQNRGVGRRLLHALCAGRRERTAVLSTHDRPGPARHLYHSVGFTDLITGFVFPGGYEEYAILGAVLPLRSRTIPPD